MFKKPLQITLATVLTATAPGLATAGKLDVGLIDFGLVIDDLYRPGRVDDVPGDRTVLTSATTRSISQGIADSFGFCAGLAQKEYTVDCLRERIETLAASLPDTGEYAEAKQVLEETAQDLGRVVARNRSVSKPRARARGQIRGTPVVTAPLTPVREETVKPSIEEAVAILDEASTKLLRSAGNSDRRKVHYQEMATAMGSNKILLRSA